ncbi:MAG: glycosyltransferase family 39 protein, partial [Candidatus Zixiibacteriota bacterium]
PYFLALLAWVTGSSVFWAKLLQVLVCFGTVFFLYRLAERLFGDKVALLAGLMYAFYGTLVLYETLFLIPVVFVFFLVWGMYRVVAYRDSHKFLAWLLTGLVFGLAAVSRPNVLLVIPFLMIWLFAVRRETQSFVACLKRPVALFLGVALAISPVTVRNALVTGDFILISSQGGVNLYLGNNPTANGLYMVMPEAELDESLSWRDFIPLTKTIAEKEAGHELSAAEQSAFWTGKAVSFITDNPGKFLGLVWKKTVYLLSGFENSDNMDVYHERTKSNLYAILLWSKPLYFPFGLLLPLAIAGVYIRRKDTRLLTPLYVFTIAYVPSIVLFLVTARHRLPLAPFLIVIAAAGIVGLVQRWQRIRKKDGLIAIVMFVIALLLFNRTFYEAGGSNVFQIHFNNGIKYERLGDYVSAEREYRLADQEYPYSAALVNNLAHAQYQLGRFEEADRNFHRALALNPDYGRTYNNLGLLVRDRGSLDSAATLFRMAVHRYDTTGG